MLSARQERLAPMIADETPAETLGQVPAVSLGLPLSMQLIDDVG
jgi:hypothetical protein